MIRGGRAPLAAALALAVLALAPDAGRAQVAGPAQPQRPAQPAQPPRPVNVVRQTTDTPAPLSPSAERMMQSPAVLKLPGEAAVTVQRDVVYGTAAGRALRFDLYLPPRRPGPLPAIVFVSGASDTRGWGIYGSYGRLAAAQDFAGIVYEKRYERSQVLEGVADTQALLDYLHENGRKLGIDPARIVLWGFSGGGLLLAGGIDARRPEIRALIGFYPVLDISPTLPFYGDSLRTRAKATASPADIAESRPLALPPTLIARAGRDDPTLNSGISRFVRIALDANRPIELINVAGGRHAFDLLDDNEESRRAIRRAFEFAKEQTQDTAR